ncbi:MAG: hypothetical protein FJX55_20055 [Alphaproteobacteria bacterium]|nr:hypothetical protein [Alphaproteobacteria bacterium]
MVPVLPLGMVVVAASGAIAGTTENGPFPGTSVRAEEPRLERLYRDGGRVVGSPILDLQAAERACPNGHQVRRHDAREDGSKVFLVWTLRCR